MKVISIIILLLAGFLIFSMRLQNKGIDKEPVPKENRIIGEIEDSDIKYEGSIQLEGIGVFNFNPDEIQTTRKDIFKEGHFSLFDILVHLDKSGDITLDHAFDEAMNTSVINSINGNGSSWWYQAYYDGGWPERNVFRMDHFPYKDKITIQVMNVTQGRLDDIFKAFREEVNRKNNNNGDIIIPNVSIRSKSEQLTFTNVEVKAHNLREDIFQEGVITAIDVIMSLGDEDRLTYDLKWFESIGTAGVVRSYWVNRINRDEGQGKCGFVYEAGPTRFRARGGNHIHIPSDTRVINSPEYVEWFWICLK